MNKVLDLLHSPAGRVVAVVTLFVLMLGLGFIAGRSSKPQPDVKVVEKEVIKTVEVVKYVEIEKKVDTKKVDAETNKHVHKEKVEVIKPDGTKTTTETTDVNATKVIHK